MTERNPDEDINERPVFEALLTPHRSLDRRGFTVLMLVFGGICLINGFVFLMAGAWPVFGFCGLDIVLLFGAFYLNFRAARAREEVRVSRTLLEIRKFAPSGRRTEYLFNPVLGALPHRPARRDRHHRHAGHGRRPVDGCRLVPEPGGPGDIRLGILAGAREGQAPLAKKPARIGWRTGDAAGV